MYNYLFFFTGIRLIVLSIISMIGLLYISMIFFFLQFELTKNLSLVYHILDIFGVSPNMYVMTVSFSSWLITAAYVSQKLIKISSSNLFYIHWPRLLMKIEEYSILFILFWICNLFLIEILFVWPELSDNSKAILKFSVTEFL